MRCFWSGRENCSCCPKEKKKYYDYSYKKYYVEKCHCKCCFEPYYKKDDDCDHKKDYDTHCQCNNYNHKEDYHTHHKDDDGDYKEVYFIH